MVITRWPVSIAKRIRSRSSVNITYKWDLEQSFRLGLKESNNEAEYKALLSGLHLARTVGTNDLEVFCDSQLLANHFSGDYKARDEWMIQYLKLAQELTANFVTFKLTRRK